MPHRHHVPLAFALSFLVFVGYIFFFGPVGAQQSTAPNLKVAFIGDQGLNENSVAVLNLIKNEGAELVVHSGDFDYNDDIHGWDKMISKVLGKNFPYLASAGNHDVGSYWQWPPYWPWPGYQDKLENRVKRNKKVLKCDGDLGVNSVCKYKGLFILLSGVGTIGSGHVPYITSRLNNNPYIWKICSWHKDQEAMQIGGKPDEVGWGAYEACREGGAIIATGHEHSYERTKTLTDISNQVVDPTCSDPNKECVSSGRTFVFVSGLGGDSIRDQERCLDGCNGEWAKIYTSNQGAQYGALFIIFNYMEDPYRAHGYFKNINGQIIDEFDIMATPPIASSVSAPSAFSNMPKVVMPQILPLPVY